MITAFGIADATGSPILPETVVDGRPVFRATFASGFIVYVEGRPGPSGLKLGMLTYNRSPADPAVRPDIQIQANRNLGDGSPASCDNSAPDLGGVPGMEPADFSVAQPISDALNDFGCRFGSFGPPDFPCTQDGTANFSFTNPNTALQFCVLVSNAIAFPRGDTTLTVRLRDSGGNVGASSAIVVRVAEDAGPE